MGFAAAACAGGPPTAPGPGAAPGSGSGSAASAAGTDRAFTIGGDALIVRLPAAAELEPSEADPDTSIVVRLRAPGMRVRITHYPRPCVLDTAKLEGYGLTILASDVGTGRYVLRAREPVEDHGGGAPYAQVDLEVCDEHTRTVCATEVRPEQDRDLDAAAVVCASVRLGH